MSDVTRRSRNSDKILWSRLLMICLLRLEVKTKVGEMEKKKGKSSSLYCVIKKQGVIQPGTRDFQRPDSYSCVSLLDFTTSPRASQLQQADEA
jgi:hypothetical protein